MILALAENIIVLKIIHNDNTYGWSDLWQFTMKNNWTKLDDNLQLILAIAAKVVAMI